MRLSRSFHTARLLSQTAPETSFAGPQVVRPNLLSDAHGDARATEFSAFRSLLQTLELLLSIKTVSTGSNQSEVDHLPNGRFSDSKPRLIKSRNLGELNIYYWT